MTASTGRSTVEELAAAWNQLIESSTPLAFGPWSMVLRGDEVADICHNGTLVLRSLRVVVRDGNWGTPPAVVSAATVTETAEALEVHLAVRHTQGAVDFAWNGVLRLSANELHFAFDGTALTTFTSNRIGFTVLHPPTLAGHEVTVRHPDGTNETVLFTEAISPHQPAKNIAALSWKPESVDNNCSAEIEFLGEIFETEDQRNWTDASFKTYSTPLEIPFPVQRSAGEKVSQSVTLRCEGGAPATVRTTSLKLGAEPSDRVVPELTVGASTAPASTAASAPASAPAPIAAGVLVELNLADANWPAALERAVVDSAGRPLDVRLVVAQPAELAPALDALVTLHLSRLAVFDSTSHVSEAALWEALVAGVAERLITAELVGGTRGYFTELNRTHERLAESVSALTFSITPQMHSLDREQLVESIGVQRTVAVNARRIAAGRPLHIGPVTLRARFNAVATDAQEPEQSVTLEHGYGAQLVDGSTDARQQGRALAAWLVASVDALAVPDVRSISYFEAWGDRGVVSADGTRIFPVAVALEWLNELRGETLLTLTGDTADDVSVLATRANTGSLTVLVANLSDVTQLVRVSVGGDGDGDGGGDVSGTLDALVADASGSWRSSSRQLPADAGVLVLEIPAADVVRWQS
jgi:hypothetical protein